MKRLELTLPDEVLKKIEEQSSLKGFTKSKYIEYVVNGCKDERPEIIKQAKLVEAISNIDIDLRALIVREELTAEDKLKIDTYSKDIRDSFQKYLQLCEKGR